MQGILLASLCPTNTKNDENNLTTKREVHGETITSGQAQDVYIEKNTQPVTRLIKQQIHLKHRNKLPGRIFRICREFTFYKQLA